MTKVAVDKPVGNVSIANLRSITELRFAVENLVEGVKKEHLGLAVSQVY